MPKLGASLDFAQLEARQMVVHWIGSPPAVPVKGQMYFNTANNTLWWWDGSEWVSARGGASATPPATTGALGTIQLAGDLSGTATSPQIAAGVITDAEVAAGNKDGVAATPSLRTLGFGAQQALSGTTKLNHITGPDALVTMNLQRLTSLPAPSFDSDAANKLYVDSKTAPDATPSVKGIVQLAGDLAGTAASPQIAAGAVTDAEVAAANKDGAAGTPSMRTIGSGGQQAMSGSRRLDQITAASLNGGNVDINAWKILNLADPQNPLDGANKQYVDAVAQGLDAKGSVKVASTAPVTLSGTGAIIDGRVVATDDRVLVKDQAAPATNGIYVVGSGAWARATDLDSWSEVPGAFVFVEEGAQQDTGWVCTADRGGTLNTTAMPWTQFSGAGQITAGGGMTKSGNTLDVGAGPGITVNADTVQVANNGITNAMLADAAVNLNSNDVSGTLPVVAGGTGSGDAPTARSTLGAAGYYSSATHGAGATISIPRSTHLLRASRGLMVQAQEEATGLVVEADVTVAASGDVTVAFGGSQAPNAIRVTIIG